ncbi:MAG: DUF3362 domain-containing protein [Candidatus Woesearchaeota archaeon]
MPHDITLVTGELYFDHPLCGVAILKRLLEKHRYTVNVVEQPNESAIKNLAKPNLFFGVTSGSIDSMLRNYTPLKKPRKDDPNLDYTETVPDRATIVYSNWVRKYFKDSIIVLGGTEASLRRFVHYDYWDNKLRKPILLDSRAQILAYGFAEKQILEIAAKIKKHQALVSIPGTCIITKEKPAAPELPSYAEVLASKEKFCEMQNMLSNDALCQKVDNRYVIQYKAPPYTSQDLDEYYELPFTRATPLKLRGFEFSVVTHRGCTGNCNFCSVRLMQSAVVSRSEESILREITAITKLPHFKGNIDDLTGPTANMYGIDIGTSLLSLLRKARVIPGVQYVYVKSGIRFDLASPELIAELLKHHVFDTLRVAPEHINKYVLKLMNKSNDLDSLSKYPADKFSYYFMTAHPGSTMQEAKELAEAVKKLKHAENVQVFTPTPMTVSTCMYYTGLNPKTKEQVYVPYTYAEKKAQKRLIFDS